MPGLNSSHPKDNDMNGNQDSQMHNLTEMDTDSPSEMNRVIGDEVLNRGEIIPQLSAENNQRSRNPSYSINSKRNRSSGTLREQRKELKELQERRATLQNILQETLLSREREFARVIEALRHHANSKKEEFQVEK